MERWPWRWLGLAVVLVAFALIIFVPDPAAQETSLLSNEQLLERLGSPREVVREASISELLTRAKSIVPVLAAAVVKADDHRRAVMIGILQELFLSHDPVVCEAAESTLEDLSRQADRQLAKSAEDVLAANSNLRHARALALLVQLGAHVRDLELATESYAAVPAIGPEPQWSSQAHILVFDARWLGGDAGLKYLARVYPFDSLALHLTHDAPVSADGIQQLRTRRPRISVRHENESCLGVLVEESRQTLGTGVRFSQVIANSPAAQAGLRRGDTLTSFNGRKIRSFPDLQECAASCQPGDRIDLQIVRLGVVYRAKLPLGSDFRTGVCSCVASESSP